VHTLLPAQPWRCAGASRKGSACDLAIIEIEEAGRTAGATGAEKERAAEDSESILKIWSCTYFFFNQDHHLHAS